MANPRFEENYFQTVYKGRYVSRNPSYKTTALLNQILKYRTSGWLLDVGCAYGLFLEKARRYFNCMGCDISYFALRQAKQLLPKEITLFQSALGSITVDKLFDVITCFDVLEHVKDLDRAWINLNGLLKPDGLLVFTVPVYDGPFGRLLDKLDLDATHIHRRNRDYWVNQVKERYKLLEYIGIWRYYLFSRLYINLLSSHTRNWTTAILLLSKKN